MGDSETSFELFQQIDTYGAQGVTAFAVAGRAYLAVANFFNVSSHSTKSDLFRMSDDETTFELWQQLDTHGASGTAAFAVGGSTYLAMSNHIDGGSDSSRNRKSDVYALAPLLATSAPFELVAGLPARLDGEGWHSGTSPVANEALQPVIGIALVDEGQDTLMLSPAPSFPTCTAVYSRSDLLNAYRTSAPFAPQSALPCPHALAR